MTESSDCKKTKLIYLLSPSFSGSTLLTILLAQHSEIATIGELKATAMGISDEYNCSCGNNINDCPFWKKLIEETKRKKVNFSLSNFGTHFTSGNKLYKRIMQAQIRGTFFELVRKLLLNNLVGLKSTYASILRQNKEISDICMNLLNGSYFLDGSKDPQRLQYFSESNLWDISVIRIHRDGRSQSHSRRNKRYNPIDFKAAAKEWRSTIDQMDKVCNKTKEKKLDITYEDLCDNPEKTLKMVWEFLGLTALQLDWNDIDLKSKDHHILGNRMRTKKRIKISRDDKWKTELTESELAIFDRYAGITNKNLGYK